MEAPCRSDTAWVTVRDGSGVERFDADFYVDADCAFHDPNLNCFQRVLASRTGGYKIGFVITAYDVNLEGQVRAQLRRDDNTLRYASPVTYRRFGVYAFHGPFPSSATRAPGATLQYADTTFSAWGHNVNTYYPATYTSSNPGVATISSSGLATAVNCGTTTITTSRPDGRRSGTPTASTTLTVTPCAMTAAISGPSIVQYPDQLCTYTVSVSGGQTPYVEYHWYSDGTWLGCGQTITTAWNYTDGTLDIWVRDSANQIKAAAHPIAVDPNGPLDPRCSP